MIWAVSEEAAVDLAAHRFILYIYICIPTERVFLGRNK